MRLQSPVSNNSSEVHGFVYRNEGDKVRHCLKKTPERVNSRDSEGKTPLIIAASFNRNDIVDLLLTSSLCDVNARDCDGYTALHEAADRGYTEVVRQIVESGRCDVNIRNTRGETALMKAAIYDYIDIVRILLKFGSADPDVKDILGQSALFVALREGSHMTVDALVKAGCDVNIIISTGESALYMAIHSPLMKTLEPAKRIIEAGYDISVDKMWLLNEEKHILFYHDDDFYAKLRRNIRRFTLGEIDFKAGINDAAANKISEEGASFKQTGAQAPNCPPFSMSPMIKQKIISTEAFNAGLAMDWSTPPGSPLHCRRTLSRSSCSSPRPSLTSKSSFESDTSVSPTSSPVILTYPTAHINLHKFTRQTSESFADMIESISTPSANTSFEKLPESNYAPKSQNLKTLDTQVKNYKRQQSEKLRTDVKAEPQTRKLSLPSKPSVHFSSHVQILEVSKRH